MSLSAILVQIHPATGSKPARLSVTAQGMGVFGKPLNGKSEVQDQILAAVQEFTDNVAWNDSHWIGGSMSVDSWVFTRVPDVQGARIDHTRNALPGAMYRIENTLGRTLCM